jgi:hypothetical protein
MTAPDFDEYAALHADPDVTRFAVRVRLDRMEAWRHLASLVGRADRLPSS